MQSGNEPEDIQTILGRFHTWAGKKPGNGKLSVPQAGAVREVSYEEAMRNYRQRHKAPARRAAAAQQEASSPAPAPEPPLCSPEQAQPVPPALAPDLDVHFSAPPEASREPAALVRRPSAPTAKAAPALPPGKKIARKTNAGSPENVSAQPPLRAAVARQPKAAVPAESRSRRSAPAKKSTALALQPAIAAPIKPAFKKVLAKTVRTAQADASETRATASDRNQRITTRFSAAEQLRLERAAAQSGLSVSAWLRHCALLAERASVSRPAPAPPAKTAKPALPAPPAAIRRPAKTTRRALSAPTAEPTLFSTPAPSGIGTWLSLLRQRFLASPSRFSERA